MPAARGISPRAVVVVAYAQDKVQLTQPDQYTSKAVLRYVPSFQLEGVDPQLPNMTRVTPAPRPRSPRSSAGTATRSRTPWATWR